jgi:hypothetical protein
MNKQRGLLSGLIDTSNVDLGSGWQPSSEPPSQAMGGLLQGIYNQYPALNKNYGFNVIDSRGKPSKYNGLLEFYPPDESENPNPGRPTIEVFDKDAQGGLLSQYVMGDMLHYLP